MYRLLTLVLVAAAAGSTSAMTLESGSGSFLPVPVLTKSGVCPGPMTLTVTGATPLKKVAFFYGFPGSFTNPNPPCVGLVMNIVGLPGTTPTLIAVQTANIAGVATLSGNVPAALCGRTVQAVDVASCTTSNTITL